MNFISKKLNAEYQRWVDKLNKIQHHIPDCKITVEDILYAHFQIVDFFIDQHSDSYPVGGIGPRDINLLISATSRQNISYYGTNKWKDDFEKCATLLYGIIKDHPFHDCNKRTGLLTTMYYLYLINRVPKKTQKTFEKLMLDIAANNLYTYKQSQNLRKENDKEIYLISDFLKRNTRKIDKRFYYITYHQLNKILQKYNYELKNPRKGFIDLVKKIESKKIFTSRSKIKEQTIFNVVFPGWSREVKKGVLNKIRKHCSLSNNDLYDSQTFYKGKVPISKLIEDYEGPLKRLAYR